MRDKHSRRGQPGDRHRPGKRGPSERKPYASSEPQGGGGARYTPSRQEHRPDRHEQRQHKHWGSRENTDDTVLLYGIHPVEAALLNAQRKPGRLFLTENAERRLKPVLEGRKIAHEAVSPKDLDRRLGPETVHQGALLETVALPEPALEDLAALADTRPLIVLDQVTDPHNVGAILRSAAVFGAAGLVMTRRHSPPLDGTLAKSASGALELVPVALVANLARTIEELKDLAFLVVGLDGEGETALETIDWKQRVALVLGAEGKGLRQLTRENCDLLCRISADGPLASLNVSNAAAVALHFASFRRQPQT